MKTFAALTLAVMLVSPVMADAPLRPEGFAHKSGIATGSGGPFYQLALPLAVYQGVKRADLGDLRVFNGQGEVVPYALLRAESRAEMRRTEHAAPFFPLLAAGEGAASGDVSVTVRQTGDGTLVAVHQSPAKARADTHVRGVVIDASKLPRGVRSLRLNAGPSPVPFHAYVIESSTDLQHWRQLKGDAQLVRLAHEGHQVVSDTAEWGSDADPYLRLLWVDPQQAPAIRSVSLGLVERLPGQPAEIWSDTLAPSISQANTYEYVLPGQLPLEKLRINLPQINTLTPLGIQGQSRFVSRRRHREEVRWDTLAHTVAYRLASPQGEIRSPDVELSGRVEDHLRLVIDGRTGGVGGEPPSLQVGFVPHVLVFLARGDGPFVLTWGAESVNRGELPIATLLPGYEGIHKLTATPATLSVSGESATVPMLAGERKEDAPLSSKWILWSVMLVGLLVLGGMARTLIKQLRQDKEASK